jgi:hypothetical protein
MFLFGSLFFIFFFLQNLKFLKTIKLMDFNPHFRFYKSFAIFAKKKNRVLTEFLQK